MSTGERWVWVPFEVDKKYDGYRIDRFLTQRLMGYSRSKIQGILAEARVLKENRPAKPNTKVRSGDKIQIAYLRRPEAPLAADAALPILFEDADLLIVNKSGRSLYRIPRIRSSITRCWASCGIAALIYRSCIFCTGWTVKHLE